MIRWISITDKLPTHHQNVYVLTNKGQAVSTFVDSKLVNETLIKNGYSNECVDIEKNPYYFVSNEVRQHTFNNVTHWMPLIELIGEEK